MTGVQQQVTKTQTGNKRIIVRHYLYQSTVRSMPGIKRMNNLRLIKRLSPFLLMSILLPFSVLIYLSINEQSFIEKISVTGIFLLTEVNILFLDFALWNYFEGKTKWKIWLIEAIALCFCSLLALY